LFLLKYVGGIHGCTTQAFPGATIGRLSELVSSGRINLRLLDCLIIHVGTNNEYTSGFLPMSLIICFKTD
jgi:hypothetical protein